MSVPPSVGPYVRYASLEIEVFGTFLPRHRGKILPVELFSRVHATLQPALFVGSSVGKTLLFFGVFGVFASPLLPK